MITVLVGGAHVHFSNSDSFLKYQEEVEQLAYEAKVRAQDEVINDRLLAYLFQLEDELIRLGEKNENFWPTWDTYSDVYKDLRGSRPFYPPDFLAD